MKRYYFQQEATFRIGIMMVKADLLDMTLVFLSLRVMSIKVFVTGSKKSISILPKYLNFECVINM